MKLQRLFSRWWPGRAAAGEPDAAPGGAVDGNGRLLAEHARRAARAAVLGETPPEAPEHEGFRDPVAMFVTVESPPGELHGCIGTLEPRDPPFVEAARLARDAATGDTRFPAVRVEDLEALSVKVSILGPRERLLAATPDELRAKLRPDVDGVILELPPPWRTSLFLPEVWRHFAGDVDEFLAALCRKQGAPPDAWLREWERCRILVFQTAVYAA